MVPDVRTPWAPPLPRSQPLLPEAYLAAHLSAVGLILDHHASTDHHVVIDRQIAARPWRHRPHYAPQLIPCTRSMTPRPKRRRSTAGRLATQQRARLGAHSVTPLFFGLSQEGYHARPRAANSGSPAGPPTRQPLSGRAGSNTEKPRSLFLRAVSDRRSGESPRGSQPVQPGRSTG
jgi:hypothetical protein